MEHYEKLLIMEYRMGLATICTVVIVLISVIIILLVGNRKIKHRGEKIATNITGFVLIISVLFLGLQTASIVKKMKIDIDNKCYIMYTGNYIVKHEGKNTDYCYINEDGNSIRLQCLPAVNVGEYVGYVLYSKNSLYALEIIAE